MSDLQIPAEAEAVAHAFGVSPQILADTAPLIVAAAYRAVANELEPVRAEWREIDGRSSRSSALGYAISLLRQHANELDGGAS